MRIDGIVLIQLNAMRQLNFEIAFIKPLESNNQAAAVHTHRHAHTLVQLGGRHNAKQAARKQLLLLLQSRTRPLTLKAAAVS